MLRSKQATRIVARNTDAGPAFFIFWARGVFRPTRCTSVLQCSGVGMYVVDVNLSLAFLRSVCFLRNVHIIGVLHHCCTADVLNKTQNTLRPRSRSGNRFKASRAGGARAEDAPPPLSFLDVPYFEGDEACDEKHRLDVYIPSAPFPRARSRTCLFAHGG